MKLSILFFIGLVVFLTVTCKPKIPPAIGDETRSAAQVINPGVTVDDKVSAKWDAVDWKRFAVNSPTPATVKFHWDDPSIQARVTLRDMFGGAVADADHSKAAPTDTLTAAALKEGTYFLEIEADKGSSVYTVELLLGDPGAGGSHGVPRPE